jgi:hypothetical protein
MDSDNYPRRHKRLYRKARRDKLPRLLQKYGTKCFWCGHELPKEAITVDHYIPLSKGGSNNTENLRIACYGCNQKRGNAMPEDTPQIIAQQSCVPFPSHWKKPKYYLGQQMKQGQIVGIEYDAPGTKGASLFGEDWTYWLLVNKDNIDTENFTEESLEPMPTEDKESEIESSTQEETFSALHEHLREHGSL